MLPAEQLKLAIALHREGRLEAAEVIYLEVLTSQPHDPDALHFLGMLRHQQGRAVEATSLIEAALAVDPRYAAAWANLGNVHLYSGRVREAEDAYARSLELNPEQPGTLNNFAILLRYRGEFRAAAEMHQRAIALVPTSSDLYHNLANTIRDAGDPELAIAVYRKAIELNPAHAGANHRVGLVLRAVGRTEEAEAAFRQWAEIDPGNPVAEHLLAAMTGEGVPDRASDAFVRQHFDDFAQSFDFVLMEHLDYRAPALVGEAIARVRDADGSLDVLDAGCGTGLCAPYFRPFARLLIGIDLSPAMLARAQDRGGYDALHEAEITDYLRANPDSFDVIASADSLIYFGDLERLAESMRVALRPGGHLVATFERLGEDDDPEDGRGEAVSPRGREWRVGHHGRYLHGEGYIRRVFGDTGFEIISMERSSMRREHGSEVDGLVVTARLEDEGFRGAETLAG